MPGRTSGEVRPTPSGSDAASQEAEKRQSADAGQSPSVASLPSAKASSGYAGLKKYTENDRPLTDIVVFTASSGS